MEIPVVLRKLEKMLDHENIEQIRAPAMLSALHEMAACEELTDTWRAESRKSAAIIKNIMRTKGGISVFEILLTIQATPFGVEIARRIIYYATQHHLHHACTASTSC